MRWLALFLFVMTSPVGLAQDAAPDTTNPASYYPLEIGNRWEYVPAFSQATPYATHYRETIVADTLIDGDRWFIHREQGFRSASFAWEQMVDERAFLRFDPDSANVLRWTEQGVEPWLPCRLDGPLGYAECAPGSRTFSQTKEGRTVRIGADEVERAVLAFDGAVPGPYLAAGIGALGGECEGGCAPVLVYASVGESTYGTLVQGMPAAPEVRWPAIPDTTSPARYAPLSVGDVWHYRDVGGLSTLRQARRVLRDSTIRDTTYAVVEVQTFPGGFSGMSDDAFSTRLQLLRFDSTQAIVRQRSGSREVNAFYTPCRLDAPFPGPNESGDCTDGDEGGGVVTGGSPDETLRIGEETISAETKSFDSLGYGVTVAADIGRIVWSGDGSGTATQLEYAFVGGTEIGTPIPFLPIAVASPARPDAVTFALRSFPSPTTGLLTLALDLPAPGPVELAAFDALGRRVWQRELATGVARVDLDASAWAPGLYVVRAVSGDAISTATVIRR